MAQSLVKDASITTIEQVLGDIVPGWAPRPHPISNPEFHHLQGQYCRLELLNSNTNPTTIEQLYEVFKPTEQTHFTYLSYGPFETRDHFAEFIRTKEASSSNTILYSIIVDDRAVGFAGYLRIVEQHGTIEIGHVNFSQQLVRTRQGTEAIYLLLQLVFDTLGYRRVQWRSNRLNDKSRQAALRMGFQYEGTWINMEVCKGRSRDISCYSIVNGEWPRVREEFQRWLSNDNFDVNGQQLTKLNAAHVHSRNLNIST